jgi:two-component system, cell cycle response regulator
VLFRSPPRLPFARVKEVESRKSELTPLLTFDFQLSTSLAPDRKEKTMKVLVAEDDPVSFRVVETMLKKWGYQPVMTRDGAEAWAVLQAEECPQLAILDWMMPGKDGLALCREIRRRPDRPYVYVLLLTARTQECDLIAGLEAGADDYLTKPFNAEELRARLFAGERILGVQQQLVEAREAARIQAIRDPLTNLFNRRHMEETLERELGRARRLRVALSVLMLDLDHFKRFNDRAGHPAGDAMLRELASLLQARTRREDVACRYGGEEFILILPGMTLEIARRRGEELRQAVGDFHMSYQGQPLGRITLSVGVACFPEHGTTGEELLGAADEALYWAKEQGRDRVVVYQKHAPATSRSHPDQSQVRGAWLKADG